MQLHKLRTLLCSQANHARTSQNIVSGRERAAATDVSRIVAVAHTTMSIGMDNTTRTINQPLVRNTRKTTLVKLWEKLVFCQNHQLANKNTHCQRKATATHVGPSTGQSEEDYIGDLPPM